MALPVPAPMPPQAVKLTLARTRANFVYIFSGPFCYLKLRLTRGCRAMRSQRNASLMILQPRSAHSAVLLTLAFRDAVIVGFRRPHVMGIANGAVPDHLLAGIELAGDIAFGRADFNRSGLILPGAANTS